MEEDTEIEANFLNPAISFIDLREFLSEQSGLISEGAHTNLSPRTFLFKSLEFKSSLSKTERKLLTELEKHPNIYITREQLALRVWGSVGMDDTKIESRMAQLSQPVRRIQEKWTKQKLEPEELIQIKWKKGYKLVQPIPEK
ncbi:winged helix-turn-helix domain-containing protein [Enterococcus sp. LJL90]